jgi:hypothetical protein
MLDVEDSDDEDEEEREPLLPPDFLNVHMLQVCRRFYHEAALLLYSSNTFSFHQGEAFQAFMVNLIPAQLREIRSLRFHICLKEGSRLTTTSPPWMDALKISSAKSLVSLRHLRVNVKFGYASRTGHAAFKNMFFGKYPMHGGVLHSLLNFQRCALDTVRVTVGDRDYSFVFRPGCRDVDKSGLDTDWRWTLDEKRQLAARLENKILKEWNDDLYEDEQAAERYETINYEKARLRMDAGTKRNASWRKMIEAKIKKSEDWEAKKLAARMKKKDEEGAKKMLENYRRRVLENGSAKAHGLEDEGNRNSEEVDKSSDAPSSSSSSFDRERVVSRFVPQIK